MVCLFKGGLSAPKCSGVVCQLRDVRECFATSGVFCQFRSVQERVASSGVVCQLTNVSILTANFVPLNAPLPLCSNQQNVFPLSVFHD